MLNKIRNVLGLSKHPGSCHQSKAKPLQKHGLIFSVFILHGDSGLMGKKNMKKRCCQCYRMHGFSIGTEIVLTNERWK